MLVVEAAREPFRASLTKQRYGWNNSNDCLRSKDQASVLTYRSTNHQPDAPGT